MKVVQLQWETLNSNFGTSWYAKVEGLGGQYSIWIDPSKGHTVLSDPTNTKHTFNNVDEAKEWSQKDFESKILKLVKLS